MAKKAASAYYLDPAGKRRDRNLHLPLLAKFKKHWAKSQAKEEAAARLSAMAVIPLEAARKLV